MAKHYWVKITPEFVDDLRKYRLHETADIVELELPRYHWSEEGMQSVLIPENDWKGQSVKENCH